MMLRIPARSRPVAALLTALVVVIAGLVACSDDDDTVASPLAADGSTALSEEELLAANEALCRAEQEAARGDIAEAEAGFFDGAHQFLHEIAPRVEEVDAAIASDLLIAKSRVETGLRERREGVERDLGALQTEFRDAAGVIGMSAPACPPN